MTTHADEGEFGFQIAPMLDVLFVLLLFFMVSVGMPKQEASLTTPLPGPDGPGQHVPVNLDITAEGQVLFNGVPTDGPDNQEMPQMITRLKAVLADAPDRSIILKPDPSTRQQRVIDVMNACKGAHVKNLGFASVSD